MSASEERGNQSINEMAGKQSDGLMMMCGDGRAVEANMSMPGRITPDLVQWIITDEKVGFLLNQIVVNKLYFFIPPRERRMVIRKCLLTNSNLLDSNKYVDMYSRCKL